MDISPPDSGGDQTPDTSQDETNRSVKIEQCDSDLTFGVSSKLIKLSTTKESKMCVNFDEKVKTESDVEVTELLGSVTTTHRCPGTRTSARVIQKMKQDQSRPLTPPNMDRDQKSTGDKILQKTSSHNRPNKPTWTNLERNHFFDAVNEYGKDFEAIGNYINSKLKRKSTTDFSFKTKDQVRQHYYQTFHKLCKYIKFSEELKKPIQELYALINYGEMRRKLQFVTDKHFMKLRNLVYQGDITVRCKGKNVRIKTPSCKALRKLNQLDDSLEDIRLPSKIEVTVIPANMETFGRVQRIAQNPRARAIVPLQKKLFNFIKTFQMKWRSHEMKMAEEAHKLFHQPISNWNVVETDGQMLPQEGSERNTMTSFEDPEMCFRPKPGVSIHRPLLSITEYLSSVNICLSAYEERMGIKVRGETLNPERNTSKRQRTDSGSEKKSPDAKKIKSQSSPTHESSSSKEDEASENDTIVPKSESSSDECGDDIVDLLTDLGRIASEESDALNIVHTEPIPNVANSSIITLPPMNRTTSPTPTDDNIILSSAGCNLPCSAFAANTTSMLCGTSTPAAGLATNLSTAMVTGGSINVSQMRTKRGNTAKTRMSSLSFKPLISNDVISRIRKGWTVTNAADITIGDLYVVFGQDSKLELEYYWTQAAPFGPNGDIRAAFLNGDNATEALDELIKVPNGLPYNFRENSDSGILRTLSSASVNNKLKHLLLIANLSERIRKRQCACGHTCERTNFRTRIERERLNRTFVSNRTVMPNSSSSNGDTKLFRQPAIPVRRPMLNLEAVKQLNSLPRSRTSRQVLVQRLLLPGNGNQSYDVLDVQNLQNRLEQNSNSTGDGTLILDSVCDRLCDSDNKSALPLNLDENSSTNMSSSEEKIKKTPTQPLQSTTCLSFMTTSGNNTGTCAIHCDIQDGVRCHGISAARARVNASHAENYIGNNLKVSHCLPPESAFDESTNTSLFSGMNAMNLLRDSTSNSRWLEENINDFSLTSLLGHLDEINANRDLLDPSSNLSVISESSVDYRHKFQEITSQMQAQDKE